jgi:hypothetical protein
VNRKLNLGLSLAAGLLGGFLSHYISLESVHAAQVIPAKEIRAQRFVLVNSDGGPAGMFGFDREGRPDIVLYDNAGKIVWSTRGNANSKPLAIHTSK